MSVDSPPLGATRSGAFDLRRPALEARTRAPVSRLGLLGLAGMLATGLLVSISAASTLKLLPQTLWSGAPIGLAGSFGHTGINLGSVGLTVTLGLMFVSYVVTVACARRLSPALVLGCVAALNALILLAPVLASTDIFSYQFYGRIGQMYHFNPYLAGPKALAGDPLYQYIGSKWIATPTVYGPVFTALSYVLAPLSIAASVFAYKAIAALSSIAIVALVWNGARLRGVDQVKATALVGLNPLIIIYGVGGGHNDLLMLAPMVAGLVLILQRRDRLGAASIVLGAAIKVTAGILLPFALADARGRLSRGRRRDLLIGAGIAAALVAVFAFVMFGTGPLNLPATIETTQSKGNGQSIPGFIGTHLGLGAVGLPASLALGALFAAALCWLLWRVWCGRLDWIVGAGWAAVALLVSAASLAPWYVAWLMPLAALGRDRRLWQASIVLTVAIGCFELLGYIHHGSLVPGL
ncbi:MAG TPA: polyprenol phosphomannose-dependent alpha 1,6 mannosyltransferase MptB [Solirubrobacteraceae bacterium]|nr:polyprenol phosphomannose-dependent alpha 1,6 mannosyltransferase MptB [Solirubrobacteraceae bacterium]